MKKILDPDKMKRVRGPFLSRRELHNAKVRITTYLDKEVLDILRGLAVESGSKYQTLLNQALRDYFLGQKKGLMARIARLEGAILSRKAA